MKAVVQRVLEAQVDVEGKTVGKIAAGLLVFLGITHQDTKEECSWLAEKIAHLRIFADPAGKMNLSVQDTHGGVLVVSQFTLYANTAAGRRPDFLQAAPPDIAVPLYEECIKQLRGLLGPTVQTGIFGAKMRIQLVNDGPVTLLLDTADRAKK